MADDKRLEIGDTVYLTSGSQRLTVTHVYDDKVEVTWMHYDTQTLHKATLPSAALDLVSKRTKSKKPPPAESTKTTRMKPKPETPDERFENTYEAGREAAAEQAEMDPAQQYKGDENNG